MRSSSLGGGRILRRTLSVCPSVCPSVPLLLPSVTSRHLANYNDTHVLFGRAAYRTAISAAQILVTITITTTSLPYGRVRLFFSFHRATLCVITVFAVVRCLSVCQSVTLVDCIQMAEDRVKLLYRSSSPIIPVFDSSTGTKFQGEPLQRGCKIHGGGEILRFPTEIAVVSC